MLTNITHFTWIETRSPSCTLDGHHRWGTLALSHTLCGWDPTWTGQSYSWQSLNLDLGGNAHNSKDLGSHFSKQLWNAPMPQTPLEVGECKKCPVSRIKNTTALLILRERSAHWEKENFALLLSGIIFNLTKHSRNYFIREPKHPFSLLG